MPGYIRSDGTVLAEREKSFCGGKGWWIAAGVFMVWAVLAAENQGRDDLAGANIPASDRAPHQHIDFIWATRDQFVRRYTRNAPKDSAAEKLFRVWDTDDIVRGYSMAEAAGGKHGHEVEDYEVEGRLGLETNQAATRCSSTNYAVTAYFCGDHVAQNMDVDKFDASVAHLGGGIDEFLAVVNISKTAVPPLRLVYRFSFGAIGDKEADFGHVWTIVATPNGTFYWLQSFIDQYSLGQWLEKCAGEGVLPMSEKELLRRVDLLRKLDRKTDGGWTKEEDDVYHELFSVRMSKKEKYNPHNGLGKAASYKGGQAHFNVACEWPLEWPLKDRDKKPPARPSARSSKGQKSSKKEREAASGAGKQGRRAPPKRSAAQSG